MAVLRCFVIDVVNGRQIINIMASRRLHYRPSSSSQAAASSKMMMQPSISSATARRRFASTLTVLLALSLLATFFASILLHRHVDLSSDAYSPPRNKMLRDLGEFQKQQRSSDQSIVVPAAAATISNTLKHPQIQQQQQPLAPSISSSSLSNANNVDYVQLSPATNKNTTSTDHHPWSWPIIHTVSTRFMQNQGTLQNLARSRLKLLEAVCLPSLLNQSILNHDKLLELYGNTKWKDEVMAMGQQQQQQQKKDGKQQQRFIDPLFLWIIKVDPDLDKQILKELNEILEPVKHFTIVVGSNNNFGVGVKNGGWRDGQAGQDLLDVFRNEKVFFPHLASDRDESVDSMYQIIRRAYEARSDRVVLETRLDADDAINVGYLHEVQRVAIKSLIDAKDSKFIRKPDDDDDDKTPEQELEKANWMYWCAKGHMEWNPSSPYFNPNNDAGLITPIPNFSSCITPGLTIGYAVGTEENDVPHYEHTKIWGEILMKPDAMRKRDNDPGCGFTKASDCLWVVDEPEFSAFRSRSLTSAGMFNIEASGVPSFGNKREQLASFSKKLWKNRLITAMFGITPEKAKEAADFMGSNYIDTVRDNIRGQCTHGHSCKISSVEKLARTIDISEEGVGGIEINSK